MLKDSTAAAACPVLIQNHCHPVGLCSTSGGCSSTARTVSLRMRVSSSRRAITRRARLSQVEVNIKVSPLPRITLAVACPLRPLYPAPSGSTARRSIGNAIFTSLAGTGRRVRTDCLALCTLSLRLRTVVTIGAGLLQLAPDRAIVPMTARNSFRHRAVQPGRLYLDVRKCLPGGQVGRRQQMHLQILPVLVDDAKGMEAHIPKLLLRGGSCSIVSPAHSALPPRRVVSTSLLTQSTFQRIKQAADGHLPAL